uniref:Alternative protein KIT n=1 Tax=Homo sapiens TaxID=9606 RepID=L8E780_HUMAN|nr:alternative protein KIT [Homo sapiens]
MIFVISHHPIAKVPTVYIPNSNVASTMNRKHSDLEKEREVWTGGQSPFQGFSNSAQKYG